MSAHFKRLKLPRFLIAGLGALLGSAAPAAACDLQGEQSQFSATIDYDVFAFERAGTSAAVRITNSGDEACEARIVLINQSEIIAPFQFEEVNLEAGVIMSSGGGGASHTLQGSAIPMSFPADQTTDVSLDFFTEQYASIRAGTYKQDITLVILGAESDERLLELSGVLQLSVEPRAQINLAGAAGDFGFETYADGVFFENPEPGDQHRLFVQSRSNALTTMTIHSQNGGKMVNPSMSNSVINYDFILDGQAVDLSAPWIVPDRPETDLTGISEEILIRISDDNRRVFAGDYEDVVTIEITTQ